MTERRRPSRRGRGQSPDEAASAEGLADANPYLEAPSAPEARAAVDVTPVVSPLAPPAVTTVPREAPAEQVNEPRSNEARNNGSRTEVSNMARRDGRDESQGESQGESQRETQRETRPGSRVDGQTDITDIGRPNDGGEAAVDDGRAPGGGGSGQRGRNRRLRHRGRNSQQANEQGAPRNPQRHPHPQSQNFNQSQVQSQSQNAGQQFAGGRRNRRNRPQADAAPRGPVGPIVVEGETSGLFDPQRDAGFLRYPAFSYLADPNDPFVPTQLIRQAGLRRGDLVTATIGRDQRNRLTVAELISVNGADPEESLRRPEFQTLTASYPERKLTLETGKPAKGGPELTRRAIDLIAPIGYGQRALIVAPARAGKTMLLQAVIEGVAINQPQAALFVLLVDERPEEVSDMISLGHGEVVASSFDMPAARHTDVAEMTLERARRLVELGQDVVIVLDSITRLARAYNTVERGTGRTLSGGLDSSAMAKPKAFFGSARSVAPEHGGGSLTIIATALVETGSRMDDVIFEEFKGTGNCEIKLDRSLAEKRIFPAIDIGVSGTRREDKLFRPDQLEHVYTLRRGLQQMPPSSAMEWLIKRIAGTQNNDALLAGL